MRLKQVHCSFKRVDFGLLFQPTCCSLPYHLGGSVGEFSLINSDCSSLGRFVREYR